MPWSQSDTFIGCHLRKGARRRKSEWTRAHVHTHMIYLFISHTHSNFRKARVNLATYTIIFAQKVHLLGDTPTAAMKAIHISAISTTV